jgi:hypothetical protein
VPAWSRYRNSGGTEALPRWEFAEDVTSWDGASAPGQLAHKVLRGVSGREPPEQWARPTTNLVHWATGIAWGVQYGVLAATTPRHPLARALALGPIVWLSGYIVLPLAKVYRPIWEYDAQTLGKDLTAHLLYGAVVTAVFAAITTEG